MSNIELPYDSAIPLLSTHPKKLKVVTQTDTCTPRFRAALFTITKRWKQPKCPLTDGWINRMCSIHTVESYSALKRKEILTPVTMGINPENMMLSEISQSQKDISKAVQQSCWQCLCEVPSG